MKKAGTLPLALLVFSSMCLAAAAQSLLDTNFHVGTGVDGIVEKVQELPNDQILLCGNFTEYDGTTNSYIARLNADGSIDTSFASQVSYWVRTFAVQPDGKIVIGGFFNYVAGQPCNLIARLNSDGSLDTSFNPGGSGATGVLGVAIDGNSDPFIFAVALQPDGKILITGNFTNYDGVNLNGICRLNTDGSLDTNFDVNGGYNTQTWGRSLLVQSNGQIMATGWFTSYADHSFNRMARINPDGSPDTTFNPYFGPFTAVYDSLELSNGDYLVVGDTETNTFTAKVARLLPDGSFDTTFLGSDDDKTESVVLQTNGQILIGGYFSTVDGALRTSIARLNYDGSLDTNFDASLDNFVWDVALQSDGKILIGGGFTQVDGVSRNGIARLLPYANYAATTPPNTGPTNTAPSTNTTTTHPGTNILTIYTNGFTLLTNGMGRLVPNLGARQLVPGQTYTVTAVPAPGYIFAGWDGSMTNSSAVLHFKMSSNLVLQANFIPDPYPTNAGVYYGLFYDAAAPSNSSAGWLTLNVSPAGAYSARLDLDGAARAWGGRVTPQLTISNTVGIRGQAVQVTMQFAGNNTVTGLVTGLSFSSPLTCYRLTAGATNYSGVYTLLLPGSTNGAPAGDGWMSLLVTAQRRAAIVGMLADNTPFSLSSVVSPGGMIPFYVSYGAGDAAAFGTLNLVGTNPPAPITGTIYWNKATPNGTNFSAVIEATGESYVPPVAGSTTLANWTNGLWSASGGDLSAPINNPFTLVGASRLEFPTPNTNRVAVSFNDARGIFAGSFLDTTTGRQTAFHGALLQLQSYAGGFFVSHSRSGLITITNSTSASP